MPTVPVPPKRHTTDKATHKDKSTLLYNALTCLTIDCCSTADESRPNIYPAVLAHRPHLAPPSPPSSLAPQTSRSCERHHLSIPLYSFYSARDKLKFRQYACTCVGSAAIIRHISNCVRESRTAAINGFGKKVGRRDDRDETGSCPGKPPVTPRKPISHVEIQPVLNIMYMVQTFYKNGKLGQAVDFRSGGCMVRTSLVYEDITHSRK